MYQKYLEQIDEVIEEFEQWQKDKQTFSEMYLKVNELMTNNPEWLIPNMDYKDNEQEFDELQSLLISIISPLVQERSKDLYKEYKKFIEVILLATNNILEHLSWNRIFT